MRTRNSEDKGEQDGDQHERHGRLQCPADNSKQTAQRWSLEARVQRSLSAEGRKQAAEHMFVLVPSEPCAGSSQQTERGTGISGEPEGTPGVGSMWVVQGKAK